MLPLEVYSWHSMLRPIRKVKKRKNWFSANSQNLLYTIFCEITVMGTQIHDPSGCVLSDGRAVVSMPGNRVSIGHAVVENVCSARKISVQELNIFTVLMHYRHDQMVLPFVTLCNSILLACHRCYYIRKLINE